VLEGSHSPLMKNQCVKFEYGQKSVVGVSDTPRTRTHGGSVPDTVSDAFYWAGNGPLSGYVGGGTFPSLDTPKKLEKKTPFNILKTSSLSH